MRTDNRTLQKRMNWENFMSWKYKHAGKNIQIQPLHSNLKQHTLTHSVKRNCGLWKYPNSWSTYKNQSIFKNFVFSQPDVYLHFSRLCWHQIVFLSRELFWLSNYWTNFWWHALRQNSSLLSIETQLKVWNKGSVYYEHFEGQSCALQVHV